MEERRELQRPVNLSIRGEDRGFMLVRTMVKEGDRDLVMGFAPALQIDTKYINIKENGEVYLY
ncbi:MAG: hypothetical protein ACFCBU_03850 [Cyanophyceae cyanobacterium]